MGEGGCNLSSSLSERSFGTAQDFHHHVPLHVFQPVPLYLVRPPPSWLSILVVFPFAVRLFFWAGGLSLILSFIFLVLWSSGLLVCWPAVLIYMKYIATIEASEEKS